MQTVNDLLIKWQKASDAELAIDFPTRTEMTHIKECAEALFTFAKFKVGDTVKMKETYPVNLKESWGWMSYRHLVTKGSKAKVLSVDWYNNRFNYLLEFYEKSWIDDKNVVHPSDTCVNLSLGEKWLTKR